MITHITQQPSVIYGQTPFMSLQLDIQIENVETSNYGPIFDTGSLPNRVNFKQALELIIGINIIDQLLWLLIDSKNQIQHQIIPSWTILICQYNQLLLELSLSYLTFMMLMDQINESIYLFIDKQQNNKCILYSN